MHRVMTQGSKVPLATAIHIRSNDHYIVDSIVFSSLLGLNMGGAANLVNGLHVWFPLNIAERMGATAFYNTGAQNRYWCMFVCVVCACARACVYWGDVASTVVMVEVAVDGWLLKCMC